MRESCCTVCARGTQLADRVRGAAGRDKALLLGELGTTLRAAFHSTLSPAATLTDRACAWLLLQHTPHRVANCIDVAASLLAQCDAIPGGDEARAVLQFGRAVELLPPLLTQAAVLSRPLSKTMLAASPTRERQSASVITAIGADSSAVGARQAEATALRRTRARLCGVCVRLHVHGLVEWVHAQSLQRLVEGFSPGEATIRTSARQARAIWGVGRQRGTRAPPSTLSSRAAACTATRRAALVCTALDRSGVFSPHCPRSCKGLCAARPLLVAR